MTLIRAKAEGPKTLGVHPTTGQNVYVIHGRFGPYVQLGENPEKGSKEKPKRSSLLPTMSESTITFDEAVRLLELPRELGTHPESSQSVLAGLGRFGPYVKHGDDYRSLEPSDDLFGIDLARALELLAQPKRAGRRQAAARRVIAKIERPDGAAPLQVLEGRYGPYITDGEVNASVPKGMDPATLPLDDALALLEARRGAAPAGRRRRPLATARKSKASRESGDGELVAAAATRAAKPTREKRPKPVTAVARASRKKAVGGKRSRA
jgi:DNA topoisomerase-1